MEGVNSGRRFFSEGILLGAAPVIAYAISYYFEVGYLNFFSLPSFLIKVSLENFFYTLSCLMGTLLALYWIFNAAYTDIERFIQKGMHLGFALMFFLLAVSSFLFVISKDLKNALMLEVIPVALAIYFFVPPLFKLKGSDYATRLTEWLDKGGEAHSRGLIGRAKAHFGEGMVIGVLLILTLMPLAAQNVGYKRAQAEKEFWMTSINGRQYVLLRKYDSNLLLVEAPYSWTNLYTRQVTFSKNFLINDENEGDHEFTLKEKTIEN